MKGKDRQCNYATKMQKDALNGFVLVGIDDGFLQGEDGLWLCCYKSGYFWLCNTKDYVKEGNGFFFSYGLGCLKVSWQGWR